MRAATRAIRLTVVAALLAATTVGARPAPAQIPPLGDVNCDQSVDVADILSLIDVIFGGTSRCGRADVNGDGVVSVADLIAVVLIMQQPSATRTPTPTGTGITPTATASGTTSLPPTATPTTAVSPSRTPTSVASMTVAPTSTPSATIPASATPSHSATATASEAATKSVTPTVTPSETQTPSATTTGSQPPTSTPTRSPSPSTTPTSTRTSTRTSTPTVTSTASFTPTITFTETPTRTRSITPTPSVTRTFTQTRTPSATVTQTPTQTVPATFTFTRTPSLTRTPTATRTPSVTPTITPTRTITPTATATPTLGMGPQITFFGLASADGTVLVPTGVTPSGDPIYIRAGNPALGGAFGFLMVIEARPGASGSTPGTVRYNSEPGNPFARPDLQIEVNRDLGNGSVGVCDKGSTDPDAPPPGGVPAISPPSYDPTSQAVADALNDFGCRFDPRQSSENACTFSSFGNYRFASTLSTVQFCSEGPVDFGYRFPTGDTLVTVRWRDVSGVLGPEARIVIRVVT